MVVVVASAAFVSLGGTARAQSPSSAADQYGGKVQDVAVVTTQQPATAAAGEESSLPNTGLPLLGAVVVGGSLVAGGMALRRRERSHDRLDD